MANAACRFSVGIPTAAAEANQFRVRMLRLRWRWTLTGIELPDKLRDQIARALANKYHTGDGARRIAVNIGKLLELLRKAYFKALAYLVQ